MPKPISGTQGQPVTAVSTIAPWDILNYKGGFEDAALNIGGEDYTEKGPQCSFGDANAARWILPVGAGLMMLQPLFAGAAVCQGVMEIAFWRENSNEEKDNRGWYHWSGQKVYNCLLIAGSTSVKLMRNLASYPTWLYPDTLSNETQYLASPGVRWVKPATPDGTPIYCYFDAQGAREVEVKFTTLGITGGQPAATRFNLRHAQLNGG